MKGEWDVIVWKEIYLSTHLGSWETFKSRLLCFLLHLSNLKNKGIMSCIHVAKTKIWCPFWMIKAVFKWISYFLLHTAVSGWHDMIYDDMIWNSYEYIRSWGYVFLIQLLLNLFKPCLFSQFLSVLRVSLNYPDSCWIFLCMHRF